MTSILVKLFVKDKEKSLRRQKIGILAGVTNAFCNLLLFIIKLIVGALSSSVAVMADAFNNLSDCGASIITIVGFKLSNKAPDKKHPFGYGRIEYVSGVVIAILILLVGFEFINSSVERIITARPVTFNLPMLIALIVAILVKLWMSFANTSFGKHMNGSSTLSATAFDSLADVLITSITIISLLISQYFNFPIDGYLGVLIALFILFGGVKVLIDVISPLLGQVPDKKLVDEIKEKLLSYKEIVGVHDMVIHNYGPNNTIVTIHAEIPANNNIIFAHEVIDKAEREISSLMGIKLLIHLDPIVTDDQRLNEIKEIVLNVLSELSSHYSMHDFRMLDGKHQINLIFDVLVPYDIEKDDDTIKQEIINGLKLKDNRFVPIITIDKSFVGE